MSTIYPQWPPSTTAPWQAPQSDLPLTPERLMALLKSGPGTLAPPKAALASAASPQPNATPSAQQAAATQSLNELSALLTPETLKQLLRNPDSEASRKLLEKIKSLLTPANIASLLHGPNTQANRKVLAAIGQLLGKEALAVVLITAKREAGKEVTDKFGAKMLTTLPKALEGGGGGIGDSIDQLNESKSALDTLKRNFSTMNATAEQLAEVGALLSEEQLGVEQTPTRDQSTHSDRAPSAPATHRFNATSDSTLQNLREVHNFKPGDKLDLSGIRNQLNQPLELVEHLTGAAGQMQIHYLPSTNTTVITITGKPGTPPFIVKIFGEVRHRDLVS